MPVTLSFQDLRRAVDASNYDGDGRNGSPGMMAFVSGQRDRSGRKFRLVGGPSWPCLIQAPDPLVLAACPAWGARPGRRPRRAARSPRRCSGGAVNVRSHLHGCPKFCARTVGATCLHGPVMHDRGGALAVIVRKDLCQSWPCHMNDRSRPHRQAVGWGTLPGVPVGDPLTDTGRSASTSRQPAVSGRACLGK